VVLIASMRTHALKIPVHDYRRFFRRHDLLLMQRPPSWNYSTCVLFCHLVGFFCWTSPIAMQIFSKVKS